LRLVLSDSEPHTPAGRICARDEKTETMATVIGKTDVKVEKLRGETHEMLGREAADAYG
jgi:hypothetical protein